MKFTLNGMNITCTPREFNELRGLGIMTAESPSMDTRSVVDACKAAGIPMQETWPPKDAPKPEDIKAQRLIDSPDFHWSLSDIGRLCQLDLATNLPKTPDKDDAIALAKDYRLGYRYTYAIAMRRKDNIYQTYLKNCIGNNFTSDIADAVQFLLPENAFDFVDARPDKNLCVVRVKVPVSE